MEGKPGRGKRRSFSMMQKTEYKSKACGGACPCTTAMFGDPDPGYFKMCYCLNGPSPAPTAPPTPAPTPAPTPQPTALPTSAPTPSPTETPTENTTLETTPAPTNETIGPTPAPSPEAALVCADE